MFVVIAGGGRTGAQLASFLVSQHHEVVVIEHRPDILAHIHRELPTEVVFEGNATDPDVLERAGVARAQVLAACMGGDADNLALCFIARTRYSVARTIATINNPRNAWLFDQHFHVDVAVNQAEILASLIEQEMSLGEMMTLLKLRRGRYSLVEDRIQPDSRAVGVALRPAAAAQGRDRGHHPPGRDGDPARPGGLRGRRRGAGHRGRGRGGGAGRAVRAPCGVGRAALRPRGGMTPWNTAIRRATESWCRWSRSSSSCWPRPRC